MSKGKVDTAIFRAWSKCTVLGCSGDKHSQKHVQTAPTTAWLEALTRHTGSLVWLQRKMSDQSYRINKSDNVRTKARQRPGSLASVSPLINPSVTWLCNTLKCSWESLTVTSGRAFTNFAHLSLTKFSPCHNSHFVLHFSDDIFSVLGCVSLTTPCFSTCTCYLTSKSL